MHRLYSAGVKVVTIKPGFVDTPMTAEFDKGLLWVSAENAARIIVKAIDRYNKDVYVPYFWSIIMLIVRNLPSKLLARLML